MFLYSACFSVNARLTPHQKHKIDKSMIGVLDAAVENLRGQIAQSRTIKLEQDFLLETYKSMKSNLSKMGE